MRKEYVKIKDKYGLPEFDSLAEDFDIEKACEKNTSFLLRDIRRTINEKISAYFHLFENFLNPANSSLYVFSLLKNVSEDDRKVIREIYNGISKLQIPSMKADTIYSEKAEADFIILAFNEWQVLKKQIFELMEKFEKGFDDEVSGVSKGYFG